MTDITWSLVIHSVSFLIFFLLFRKVFFQPLLDVLQKREEEVVQLLEEAEEYREEAVELQHRYEAKLREARQQTSELLAEEEAKAEERYRKVVDEARQHSDRTLQEAKEQIREEKDKALQEFEGESADLAEIFAEKVLQRSLEPDEKHMLAEMVGESVNERD